MATFRPPPSLIDTPAQSSVWIIWGLAESGHRSVYKSCERQAARDTALPLVCRANF